MWAVAEQYDDFYRIGSLSPSRTWWCWFMRVPCSGWQSCTDPHLVVCGGKGRLEHFNSYWRRFDTHDLLRSLVTLYGFGCSRAVYYCVPLPWRLVHCCAASLAERFQQWWEIRDVRRADRWWIWEWYKELAVETSTYRLFSEPQYWLSTFFPSCTLYCDEKFVDDLVLAQMFWRWGVKNMLRCNLAEERFNPLLTGVTQAFSKPL